MSKYIAYIAIALAIVALVVGFSSPNLGGRYHVTQESFPQGIKAGTSDTAVIDSSGNWDGAVTGTTGTFSSTFGVTGVSTFTGDVFVDNLISGGAITANTSAAGTLTAANICDSSVITQTWTEADATGTLTFPIATASVADCFLTNGDTKDIVYKNLNAVVASTSTLTTNTGLTLYYASLGVGIIPGGSSALLKFIRISSTALDVLISPLSQ